jgi:CheY-like chemotaxis protein
VNQILAVVDDRDAGRDRITDRNTDKGIYGLGDMVNDPARESVPFADYGYAATNVSTLVAPAKKTIPRRSSVLVIEDRFDLATLLEARLTGQGYAATTAHDGVMGIEIAFRERPGLILLDQTLPGLTGNEVLEVLTVDPRTGHVPVIFLLSQNEESLDEEALLARGAAAVHTKPLDIGRLMQDVIRLLSPGRNPQTELPYHEA